MGIIEQVDRHLWRKGFIHAPLRRAARNFFLFSAMLFLAGTMLLPATDAMFWCGGASLLSFWNFYTLSCYVLHALPSSIPGEDKGGAARASIVKKGLLLRTQLRLFITGILVYVSLVFFQASPVALGAGFAMILVILPAVFFPRN